MGGIGDGAASGTTVEAQDLAELDEAACSGVGFELEASIARATGSVEVMMAGIIVGDTLQAESSIAVAAASAAAVLSASSIVVSLSLSLCSSGG